MHIKVLLVHALAKQRSSVLLHCSMLLYSALGQVIVIRHIAT